MGVLQEAHLAEFKLIFVIILVLILYLLKVKFDNIKYARRLVEFNKLADMQDRKLSLAIDERDDYMHKLEKANIAEEKYAEKLCLANNSIYEYSRQLANSITERDSNANNFFEMRKKSEDFFDQWSEENKKNDALSQKLEDARKIVDSCNQKLVAVVNENAGHAQLLENANIKNNEYSKNLENANINYNECTKQLQEMSIINSEYGNNFNVLKYKSDEISQQLASANDRFALYSKKFEKIINIEDDFNNKMHEKFVLEIDIIHLQKEYKKKKEVFDELVREAAIYDETIELAELGFYKVHYDYDTSEEYKAEIDKVRDEQNEMLTSKSAILCHTQWSVNNSKAAGSVMTNRGVRLTARAFNNECDAAISRARWNNAERIGERIVKAYAAINKLNETNEIEISQKYLDLKIKEFRLTHEYKEKRNEEKEEQAAIRQMMREEQKLQEDSDAATANEERYRKLLIKVKSDAEKASGEKLADLQNKISELSASLALAHEKSERALSMAQQTKAGHVYVISNIGSFGDDVYKIGMTRRLEPIDRIKELGSASVPFNFDVHAMIYSNDAPALEAKLHRIFESRRLNLVNSRKEFFHVTLDNIEQAVKDNFDKAEFYLTAEARDYKETKAIRAQRSAQQEKTDARNRFPVEV